MRARFPIDDMFPRSGLSVVEGDWGGKRKARKQSKGSDRFAVGRRSGTAERRSVVRGGPTAAHRALALDRLGRHSALVAGAVPSPRATKSTGSIGENKERRPESAARTVTAVRRRPRSIPHCPPRLGPMRPERLVRLAPPRTPRVLAPSTPTQIPGPRATGDDGFPRRIRKSKYPK